MCNLEHFRLDDYFTVWTFPLDKVPLNLTSTMGSMNVKYWASRNLNNNPSFYTSLSPRYQIFLKNIYLALVQTLHKWPMLFKIVVLLANMCVLNL